MAVRVATAAAAQVRRFAEARPEEFGHLEWYAAHIEAYREAELQHLGDKVYLDYAGAALFSQAQLRAVSAALIEGLLANPHTSDVTARVIDGARGAVLRLFGVSSATHTLIFTSGATQALQLVGESFAWSRSSVFLYSEDNHTSVLGLRQYARRAGAPCGTFALSDLPRLHSGLDAATHLSGGAALPCDLRNCGPNLVAFPGESNFSGARCNLDAIAALRSGPLRWRVLLDAAKLAASPGALDLGRCPADFVAVSFYKIFGYPTGSGALIVRHDAAPLLTPSWTTGDCGAPESALGQSYFAGGCVAAVSATSAFAVPRPALTEWLERGTPHFLGIAALPSQIACLEELGPAGLRRRHALAVCREAYLRMAALRHRTTGVALCRIFGRHAERQWWEEQGPTIAASFHYPDGSPLPYGLVASRAVAGGILLRAGCHCNAGACMSSLGLTDKDVRYFFASGKVCGDDMGVIEGRATGVVRVSFGVYSTLQDVRRWIDLLESDLLDLAPDALAEPRCAVPTPSLPPAHSPFPAANGEARAGRVVGLSVYPIKGCGPLRVRRWPLDPDTGALFLDRRWCVAVDGPVGTIKRVRPLGAKQAPRLAQVRLSIRRRRRHVSVAGGIRESEDGRPLCLVLSTAGVGCELELPFSHADVALLRRSGAELEGGDSIVDMDVAAAAVAPGGVETDGGRWFSELLGRPQACLVEATAAAEDSTKTPSESPAHFANAPSTLLLLSTASLRDFSKTCGLAVPAERFRANLEVDFAQPYLEAAWRVGAAVRVGDALFEAAGSCVRCQAIDVDPNGASAARAALPSLLAALATAQSGAVGGANAGGGGKGPTFGALLRPWRSTVEGASGGVLTVGMPVMQVSASGG